MTTYRTHNPSTGRTVAEYPGLDDDHVDAVLARVTDGFAHWRATPPAERSSVLAAIAGGFEARSDELAAAISEEMGKPLRQAEGEVALAASIYRWYSEHGPALLRPETLDVPGARESTVSVEAVGPLVGVMP